MKLLSIVVVGGLLALSTLVHASELSLNGNPATGLGLAGTQAGRGEEPGALPRQATTVAGTSFGLDGPSVNSIDTLHGSGSQAGTAGWSQNVVLPRIPLDETPSPRAASLLAVALPMAAPARTGFSDSAMYAVVAVLFGAMLWACSGFVSRKQGAPVQANWSEAPHKERTVRVRMMPLKSNR